MRQRTAGETAIICAAGVIAIALLTIPFSGHPSTGKGFISAAVVALGLILGFRYLIAGKRAQLELTGGERCRRLADEYRRLADLAITAQEHTDLKLGDVSAQLDYLREQNESLQKILKEVE
jgi:hypothetical protein